MSTHRLAAQVEGIDPDTLAVTAEDAGALLTLTGRMTRSRLAGKIDRESAEDAAQVAALLACSLLAEMAGDREATAALASYRAALAALEDAGTSREDAADTLACDPATGEPLLRLALPVTADPARITRTTDRDRLADAVELVAREDAAAADLLAAATYLPSEDGRGWRDGSPSTRPLLALWGHRSARGTVSTSSKYAGKVAAQVAGALALAEDAGAATLSRHATRTRYGAGPDVWGQHAAQVDRCTLEPGQGRRYGRERVTARSGPASAVIHDMREGDAYLQMTGGSAPTLLALPADLDRAWLLAQVDTLPAYGRTSTDAAGDAYCAATVPLGAVRKPSARKRRRDGALGAPTVSGSTRPRY